MFFLETRIVRKVLFCKIGCGRAYASESSRAEKEVIPDGYDSLYLRGIFYKKQLSGYVLMI